MLLTVSGLLVVLIVALGLILMTKGIRLLA
jgi:hypothetical protein